MLRRLVVSALLPLIGACSAFVSVASPREYLSTKQPERVWVTRTDGAVVVVNGPQVFGDSLVGFVNGEYAEMPLGQVRQLLARQPARGRTALLITASAAVAAGLIYIFRAVGPSTFTPPEDES